MTTLSIDTPETQEAIERWRQGKINIFDDMARLERERDEARDELRDIRLNLGADAEGYTLLHAVCSIQNERDEARFLLKEAQSALDAIHLEVGGWIKTMKENTD